MVSKSKALLIAAVVVIAVVVLFVVWYFVTLESLRPLPYVIPEVINYGFLQCDNRLIIIPGNSMVILRYHVHGNVTINGVVIYMAFPASIINETLTAFSKLPNQNDALIVGIYVNGRLIASNNYPGPILGLKFALNNTVGPISAAYTDDGVGFPTIKLTQSDTLTVVIYSAVPYALPSCAVANEGEEVKLMVEEHLIGLIGVYGVANVTPTAEQLYEEGRYITEEPVIYIINVTSPISQLPQELTPGPLAEARPLATGYAPSFAMGQSLPPKSSG
ncbi:hypothetical protein JCM14467A_01620 [Vulcanisaeta sp. JCM 14467]